MNNRYLKYNVISLSVLMTILCVFSAHKHKAVTSNEIAVSGELDIRNDSLYLIVSYKNISNHIVVISREFQQLHFLSNGIMLGQRPKPSTIVNSKQSYPSVSKENGTLEAYYKTCYQNLAPMQYLILDKNTVVIEYNLTEMSYGYITAYKKALEFEISVPNQLEEYCPSIWTGSLRVKIEE